MLPAPAKKLLARALCPHAPPGWTVVIYTPAPHTTTYPEARSAWRAFQRACREHPVVDLKEDGLVIYHGGLVEEEAELVPRWYECL